MSSRRRICGASCFGGVQAAMTRTKICCPLWLWLSDWSRDSPVCWIKMFSSACVNVLKHHRIWNVGFIPGYSRSISLRSGDLSLFAFFSFCTSEASPQVVAYFAVVMATAHGKPRVFGGEEGKKKRKTLHLPLEGQLFGWAWAVSPLLSVFYCLTDLWLRKLNQNKNGHCTRGPQSAKVGHIDSPRGQSTDGLSQEEVSCGGGGKWAQSWHEGAEPSACQDCSISDPCSGSPVFPPQMDSLQKGVSHGWAALQWH